MGEKIELLIPNVSSLAVTTPRSSDPLLCFFALRK